MFHSFFVCLEGKSSIFLWFSYGFPMVFLGATQLFAKKRTSQDPGHCLRDPLIQEIYRRVSELLGAVLSLRKGD